MNTAWKISPACIEVTSLDVSSLTLCLLQIDLRFEARNIERFQENFRDVDGIKFPTPLRPFVTRNILVETFEVSVWFLKIADTSGIIQ